MPNPLNQTYLVAVVLTEIANQGVDLVAPEQVNAIIAAANIVMRAFDDPAPAPVPPTKAGGDTR